MNAYPPAYRCLGSVSIIHHPQEPRCVDLRMSAGFPCNSPPFPGHVLLRQRAEETFAVFLWVPPGLFMEEDPIRKLFCH